MTPTQEMQDIESSKIRLLKNQQSLLIRKFITEVAAELQTTAASFYNIKRQK